MKIFFLVFFFIPIFIFCAPVGNLSTPCVLEEGFVIPDTKIINFRLGFLVYDCQDLVMQFENSNEQQRFFLRKIKAYANSGLITLNIKERLDLYTELGSFRLEPIYSYRTNTALNLYKGKSESNLLCRAGAKLVLMEIGDFSLAADAKYSFFNASSSYLTQNDVPIADQTKYNMKEWQLGVGISQKISLLRPYLGIAYRDNKIIMDNTPFFDKLYLEFKKKAGIFFGSTASLGSFVMLNGEIRLINERSIAISGEIRF